MTPQVWDDVAALLRPEAAEITCPLLSHRRGEPGDQHALATRVLDALGADGPFDVVGHSFGGQVALEVALAVPQRVRTLTILCSLDTPFPPFADVAAGLRRGEPVDAPGTLSRWFTPAELDADGAAVRYVRRCLSDVDPELWADDLDAIAVYDRSAAVGALTMPVTLIAAELDHVATVSAMTALAGRLPNAALTVLPGAEHMTPFVETKALAGLLSHAAEPA